MDGSPGPPRCSPPRPAGRPLHGDDGRTAVNPTIGTRAKGWGAVSGWSSSTQPSGDAQIRSWRPTPASATIRTA